MRTLRRHTAFLAIAGLGLVLRLLLAYVVFPDQGLATDLGFFASWAQTLANVGPGSFYASAASANYPPGYPYLLWLVGLLAQPLAHLLGTTSDQAIVALIKLPAIAADMAIALLLYRAGRRWLGVRAGLVAAALYLFIPVTWYDSALWGQVDAVGAVVMLASLLLLIDGWSEAAAALAAFSILVKPQDAIVAVVVGAVLVRRHWLRPGSGPQPALGRRLAIVDDRLGGVLREQGPVRLGTSALAAALAGILPLLPFDIIRLAPASLADVPVIGHVAGLISLVLSLGNQFSVLTVNAYNPWALVGPQPLAGLMGGSGGSWTPDSLVIAAGLPAYIVSAAMLGTAAVIVVVGLLRRDGMVPILLGFSILALAFYLLPTRVHERYLFAFFAPATLLAVTGVGWLVGYGAVGILNAVNIHAVLAAPLTVTFGNGFRGGFGGTFGGAGVRGPFGGFGGVSDITLPFAAFARSEPVVLTVVLGQTLAFAVLLVIWALLVLRPAVPRSWPARARSTAASRPNS
jgi:hypothetical protein